MINLEITKRTDERLLERMKIHYSKPAGFVGRNICYAVYYEDGYYGHIVAGSATKFLPGRNAFFNMTAKDLNKIVNNVFYNVCPINTKYPLRNFTTKVLEKFMQQVQIDWKIKYGDNIIGFETLIEKPRSGDLYLKAGFTFVGETKGYTCKRVAGKGTDSWSGKRIWDTKNLRPKIVLCKRVT